MKKYMQEITDLGSPISPKLGKCSPRFRKKILNIVKKVQIISQNDEEEHAEDEKTRKNSIKNELSLKISKKNTRRAQSLQISACFLEENTLKNSEFSNKLDEFSEETRVFLDFPEKNQEYAQKFSSFVEKAEKQQEKSQNSSDSEGEAQSFEAFEEFQGKKPKNRMSLKEELRDFTDNFDFLENNKEFE